MDAIASLESAGREETKSSAGDKFETSREMMKQEIERNQQLLQQAQEMKATIEKLSLSHREAIGPGSLVQTDQGWLYLAIGIGKLVVEGTEVFVISPSAPIGTLLVGKKAGDRFTFRETTYTIINVW